MECTGLKLHALESLRTVAAQASSHDDMPGPPGPLTRVVECCRRAGAATVFDRPGLGLPANAYEHALLCSLGQAGVDPGWALSRLPPWLCRERADALIWALTDLFDFLCSERASALREHCTLPSRVT